MLFSSSFLGITNRNSSLHPMSMAESNLSSSTPSSKPAFLLTCPFLGGREEQAMKTTYTSSSFALPPCSDSHPCDLLPHCAHPCANLSTAQCHVHAIFPCESLQHNSRIDHNNKDKQFYGRKYKTFNYKAHKSQISTPISFLFPIEDLAGFFNDLESVNVLMTVKSLMVLKGFIIHYRKF